MNASAQNYALIDNSSGFVWWTGPAESPQAACAAATLDTGSEVAEYELAHSLAANEGGYHVYVAPAGFDVQDGQDGTEIAAVEALEKVGLFRRIN